ncbi:MAG: S-adenosylmethionine:tRNA ribosyltransferase-isomerase [Phycisphaerales bacterium]
MSGSSTDLRREDLDYPLDPARIATEPAEPRDAARMLVVHRERVEHRTVADLPEYLRPSDLVVVNATFVEPRRIVLERASGGRLEGLVVEPIGGRRWLAMLKGAKRLAEGESLTLIDREGRGAGSVLAIERREDRWVIGFGGELDEHAILRDAGRTPLPPYILKARRERNPDASPDARDASDRDHYQTVFARDDWEASVAAPTAGLHFTPALLDRIEQAGASRFEIELSVGPGTFRSVEAEHLADHRMDRERFRIAPEAIDRLLAHEERRRAGDARTLAVGSTSVRTLESLPEAAALSASAAAGRDFEGSTELLLAPGSPIRRCDLLLTNFHLPRSTLVAFAGAFVGLDRLKDLYALASREGYRFFSYGDAMLVLPEAIVAARE